MAAAAVPPAADAPAAAAAAAAAVNTGPASNADGGGDDGGGQITASAPCEIERILDKHMCSATSAGEGVEYQVAWKGRPEPSWVVES